MKIKEPMLKPGRIRRCLGLENSGDGYAQPHIFFNRFPFNKRFFYFGTNATMSKKHELFITALTTNHWIKSARVLQTCSFSAKISVPT